MGRVWEAELRSDICKIACGLACAAALAVVIANWLSSTPEMAALMLVGICCAGVGLAAGLALGFWRMHRASRVMADQALALRAVCDAMPVPVSIKDRDRRFVYANATQAAFLGDTPENILGCQLEALVGPGRDGPKLDDEVLQTGRPLKRIAERLASADGTVNDWFITKVPLHDLRGRIVGIGTISVDVTERNVLARARDAAERRAAETQAELAGAIDGLSDGLLLLDKNKRLIAANSVMREIYPGLTGMLVPGTPIEDLARANLRTGLFPDAAGREEEWVQERMAEFCDHPVSHEVALSDGRWLLLHNTPTASGGYCALRVDITEQKRIELDLQQAKDAAERANDAKSAFLANMSHELRTPLNAVIGFAEIIERQMFGLVGNARYVSYAGDIRHAGQHLLSIINDVLDLSKVEAGHFTLNEAMCDVQQLIGEAVRVAIGVRGDAGPALQRELMPGLPLVKGDERALVQVLINLLSNAIKFTPPNGRVMISARRASDQGMLIEVQDTGAGIAPEHIETALSAFGQVEGPLQRRHSGTGLGLPLARALVELHQGRLILRSTLGQGTTVTIQLPATRLQPALAMGSAA